MSRIVAQQGKRTPVAGLNRENGHVRIDRARPPNSIRVVVPRIHLGPVPSLVAIRIGEGGTGFHEKTAAVDVRFVTTNSPTNTGWLEILLGLANPLGNLAGQPLSIPLITIRS